MVDKHLSEYVYLWTKTLEEAKVKASLVGQIKVESGRLFWKGSANNSYQFEKKDIV